MNTFEFGENTPQYDLQPPADYPTSSDETQHHPHLDSRDVDCSVIGAEPLPEIAHTGTDMSDVSPTPGESITERTGEAVAPIEVSEGSDAAVAALARERRPRSVPVGEFTVVGRSVRGLATINAEGLKRALEGIRVRERAKFPVGIEITAERAQAVRDLQASTAAYAARAGVDISDRVPAEVNHDYIRFLTPEEWRDGVVPGIDISAEFHGVTTGAGLIMVPEEPELGPTFVSTQHELVHRMGCREETAWSTDSRNFAVGSWRRGTNVGDNFSLLDEGIAVMATDDIRRDFWMDYPSLAPYTTVQTKPELGRTRTADGGHSIGKGIIFAALATTMAERASQITGHDVHAGLLRLHFGGDVTVLRDLSQAFGNRAVTDLARLDQFTAQGPDILAFCESVGIKQDFARALGLRNIR